MFFVAILALKSHCSLGDHSARFAFPLPGNPLAQEIMSLYQEPDGTRRLLNYLLDNLAGAIKRSESPLPSLWKGKLELSIFLYNPIRISFLIIFNIQILFRLLMLNLAYY